MRRNLSAYFALSIVFAALCAQHAGGQAAPQGFAFRAGQSVYIVAYRRVYPVAGVNSDGESVIANRADYLDYDLDAERKVRKRVEGWTAFRVVDKPSDADFVFLVNTNESSMEGLAVPMEAYRQHFKEKYDIDALRDAAHGRYVVGPLKLATTSRLADRLVKQFVEKVGVRAPGAK